MNAHLLPGVAIFTLLIGACNQPARGAPEPKTARPPLPAAGAAGAPRRVTVPLGDSPARGAADAKVTLVVFSDFECPFCARVLPTLDQIRTTYGAEVRLVWKHLPLPFHDRALPAALAAEGAREQGRFWDMHDRLFAQQQALGEADLEAQAVALGLDLPRFRATVAAAATRARVESDRRLGESLGVQGTPSFFINGRSLVGAAPFEDFSKVIDEELGRRK